MHRFDDTLRARLQTNLAAHERTSVVATDVRPAAVAVAIVPDEQGHATFVLTRRSPRLRAHARQFALPGGRRDAGETAADTARRELEEEVGLAVEESAVLGLLDDYRTGSGYVITPVVVWAGAATLVASEHEVDEIFEIPLAELDRPDSPRWLPADDGPPVIQVLLGEQTVHAPTAAVLYQFREVAMHGRLVRVDDVGEPRWARR